MSVRAEAEGVRPVQLIEELLRDLRA
jgi:hypothetical protein